MEESVQKTLIIVAGITLVILVALSTFYSFVPSQNTIKGNGYSEIDVLPDLVTVYFNVETIEDSLQAAKNKNSEITDSLITNLLKKGFERKEIQTEQYSLRENYVWDDKGRTQEGYIATHLIKVEFSTENSDKIGDTIDAGIDAGAMLSYINFELSVEKQNEYKAEAIKLASQDAKIKAEAMAEGLGKKLGKLVSVSDSNFDYYPWRVYDAAISSSEGEIAKDEIQTSIQPSERTISATVIATFKIR
jgi:uncharacterized protein